MILKETRLRAGKLKFLHLFIRPLVEPLLRRLLRPVRRRLRHLQAAESAPRHPFVSVLLLLTLAASLLPGPARAIASPSPNTGATTNTLPPQDVLDAERESGYLPLPPYIQPAKLSALDKKLLAAMEDYNVVGLAAAAFQGDKLLWSRGYGWADLRSQREVTPDTIFRAASISKMVTATALMQLYEQGKFQLDDDISRYLGYPVRNPNHPDTIITFRQLLTHTSSIVDSGEYDRLVEEDPERLKSIDLKDLLTADGAAFSPTTFAAYAPGQQFSYSNLGTGIVGSLVEVLSGERFETYCSKKIFRPLALDASFDPANIKNWQNIGVLYRPDKYSALFQPKRNDFQGIKPAPLPITAPPGSALGWSPAGGVHFSIRDLSRFMLTHMNGGAYQQTRLLKKDTVDLMDELHWFGSGMDNFYRQKGLNIHVTDDLVPGRRLWGHSAEAYGLIGDAYFDPSSKFGIAFLINGGDYTSSDPYYAVENRVAKIIYEELSPKSPPAEQRLRGKTGSAILTVNGRKIIMPQPAAAKKSQSGSAILFIPEISAADGLGAKLESAREGTALTYTLGKSTVTLTVGKTEMEVNGKKIPLLSATLYNRWPYHGAATRTGPGAAFHDGYCLLACMIKKNA